MTYFLVFKSPPEGGAHVFRTGEPFAQILFVPEEPDFELVPMPMEEAAERALQSERIYAEPQDAFSGKRVDVGHQHRLRRDLSPHSRGCCGACATRPLSGEQTYKATRKTRVARIARPRSDAQSRGKPAPPGVNSSDDGGDGGGGGANGDDANGGDATNGGDGDDGGGSTAPVAPGAGRPTPRRR